MDDFLLELPKAELHLHLEGSVEPETLHELDPATPVEEFRALYRYGDFAAFLRAFGAVGKRLRTPEDYGLITRRLLERLAGQNVSYAEIIVAAGVGLWKGQEVGALFEGGGGGRTGATPRSWWRRAWCGGRGRSSGRSSSECARPRRGRRWKCTRSKI